MIALPRMDTRIDQEAFNLPVAGLLPVPLARANSLLEKWGHYLGPVNRPFGSQSWTFEVAGQAVAVAVSASTVSEHVAYLDSLPIFALTKKGRLGEQVGQLTYRVRLSRGELVELARLCSAPDCHWATRPMVRLWREVAAPLWPHWQLTAAIAYSQNSRHQGDIYRWDGWVKVADNCGSSGGGAWSRKRYATDAVHGRKTLWLWRYGGGQ